MLNAPEPPAASYPAPATSRGGVPQAASAGAEHHADFPLMVVTILSLNVLIFLLQTFTGSSTNTLALIRFGAQHGASIEEGEYWRFVTTAFLHIGFLHLLFNSLGLWILGKMLEHLIGAPQFGFVYLVSGVSGSLFSFFANEFISPRTLSAGASGAIFGVAGAMLVAGLRYKDEIPENLASAFGTGALPFIVFNLYYGFTRPGIDNFAHLGGGIAGAICGWVVYPKTERPREARLAAAGFVTLVLICFGLQFRAVRQDEKRLNAAETLYNSGQIAAAESLLSPLVKRSGEDPRVLTLSGAVKVRRGKAAEGLAQLRNAARIAPLYAPPRRAMADLLLMRGNAAAAAAEYKSAIQIDPTNAYGHLGLGEALLASNQREEAAIELREAIRLKPELAPAHYALAVALVLQEQPEEAEKEYRAAIKLDPNSIPARRGLVKLLFSQGKGEKAVEELQAIIKANPNDEWAKKTLSQTGALRENP